MPKLTHNDNVEELYSLIDTKHLCGEIDTSDVIIFADGNVFFVPIDTFPWGLPMITFAEMQRKYEP